MDDTNNYIGINPLACLIFMKLHCEVGSNILSCAVLNYTFVYLKVPH